MVGKYKPVISTNVEVSVPSFSFVYITVKHIHKFKYVTLPKYILSLFPHW